MTEVGAGGTDAGHSGVVTAATLTSAAAATPDVDPFVGSWHAVDVDDSHQFLFIEEEIDGVYSVVYYDNESFACAGQMWSGLGVRAAVFVTAIEFGTRYCLEPEAGPRNPLPPFPFEYHPDTDTLSSALLGTNAAERVNTKDVAGARKDIAQGHFDR